MTKLSDIAQEYLRSFPVEIEEDKEANKEVEEKKKFEQIKKGKLSVKSVTEMTERQKAEILFNKVLNQSTSFKQELKRIEEPVLDQYSWQDLNIIAGNTTTPDKNALSYIKRTRTATGGCVMAVQMVNPKTDVQKIKEQQEITKFFLKNQETADRIDEQLKILAKKEGLGLSLWRGNNHLSHKEYKKELDTFYYKLPGLRQRNTSTWYLQAGKWWKDFFLQFFVGFWTVIMLLYILSYGFKIPALMLNLSYHRAEVCYMKLKKTIGSSFWEVLKYFYRGDTVLPGVGFFYENIYRYSEKFYAIADSYAVAIGNVKIVSKYQLLKQMTKSNIPLLGKLATYTFGLTPMSVGFYAWYRAFKNYLKNRSILNFLSGHLVPIQDLILCAQKISTIVAKYPELEKYYGKHLQATRKLFDKDDEKEEEIESLIYNLQKMSLRRRFYFFSNAGRLLATYKLFKKHKTILADIYYEIGLMDAQISIYKLMVEAHQYDDSNYFVFGNILEAKDNKPLLKFDNMWHFGLDAKKAISNQVVLDSIKGPRTTIITGPNAGGKSTNILGTGINVVLLQVYGIAAAKGATITVFYKIITYVNPTQNLAAGLSLAEAGMEVLKKHKQIFDKVSKPILAIIDEILNGTDPKVAADYSYRILKGRNEQYVNCITLLTTHFMNLPDLSKESSLVVNKKVVVKIPGSNGRKFDYTYKIEEGIADQNIVGDMLSEKGIL